MCMYRSKHGFPVDVPFKQSVECIHTHIQLTYLEWRILSNIYLIVSTFGIIPLACYVVPEGIDRASPSTAWSSTSLAPSPWKKAPAFSTLVT